MDDPLTMRVLEMAAALISSGSRHYQHRTVSEVAAELIGCADGIKQTKGEPRVLS